MKKLSDARNYWKIDIKYGHIELVRELDKVADMTRLEEAKKQLHSY